MSDPRRFLDSVAHGAERDLLLSAEHDAGSDAAYRRMRTAIGLGAAVSLGSSASVAALGARLAGGKAAVAGAAGIAKWAAIGAVAGTFVAGTAEIVAMKSAAPVTSSAARSERRDPAPAGQGPRSGPVHGIDTEPASFEPEPPSNATTERVGSSSRGVAVVPGGAVREATGVATPPDRMEPAGAAATRIQPSSIAALPAAEQHLADDRLAQEVHIVDAARDAIASRDSARALALIDRHHREFPNGTLRTEVAVLRVQALVVAGRTGEARAEAARLLASNPTGPYAVRIRELIGPGHNP